MTEETIIDGTGCVFYNNGKCNNPNGMACNCINNAVCYFKELRRLEQENRKLLEARNHFMAENLKYFNTLEEIREKALHCIRQDVCALCDYSKECAVPDEYGLVYDNNRLLIKLINEVLGND